MLVCHAQPSMSGIMHLCGEAVSNKTIGVANGTPSGIVADSLPMCHKRHWQVNTLMFTLRALGMHFAFVYLRSHAA